MTSQRRIKANRSNARKSTGPKTERGKQLASLNALKTGAYSRSPILPTENRRAYEELAHSVYDELQPEGTIQCTLADQVLGDIVRLQRLERAAKDQLEKRIRSRAWHRNMEPIKEELRSEGIKDFDPSFHALVLERAHEHDHPEEVEPKEADLVGVLQGGFDGHWLEIQECVDERRKSLVRDIIRNTKAIEDLKQRRMKIVDLKPEK